MVTKPQRSKRRDGVLSSLDTAVGAMNLAKEVSSMTPAKAVFGTVHTKNDREVVAAWRSDLNRVLHVFNVRSADPVRQFLTAPLPDRAGNQ